MTDHAYHFTCIDHGYPGITSSGVVFPHWHPVVNASLAWFTTELEPDRQRTGLGMSIARCDRMAFRFVARLAATRDWLSSPERLALRSWDLRAMESFGDPEHWRISSVPVPALIDLTYKAAS